MTPPAKISGSIGLFDEARVPEAGFLHEWKTEKPSLPDYKPRKEIKSTRFTPRRPHEPMQVVECIVETKSLYYLARLHLFEAAKGEQKPSTVFIRLGRDEVKLLGNALAFDMRICEAHDELHPGLGMVVDSDDEEEYTRNQKVKADTELVKKAGNVDDSPLDLS